MSLIGWNMKPSPWHDIWLAAGKPLSGSRHHIKCSTKLKYKQGVCQAYESFESSHNNEMYTHFLNKTPTENNVRVHYLMAEPWLLLNEYCWPCFKCIGSYLVNSIQRRLEDTASCLKRHHFRCKPRYTTGEFLRNSSEQMPIFDWCRTLLCAWILQSRKSLVLWIYSITLSILTR